MAKKNSNPNWLSFRIERRDYYTNSTVVLRENVKQEDLVEALKELLKSYPDSRRYEMYSVLVLK